MAILKNIQCNKCGFKLLWGTGVAPYVKKPAGPLRKLLGMGGKKVFLTDPPSGNVSKEFGYKGLSDLIEEGRMGHYAAYLCLACFKVCELDSDAEKKCTKCKSTNIKSVFDMVKKPCPKCKEGTIEEKQIGIT